MGFPDGSDDKETAACNAGDPDSIPGSGRSLGEGNGSPLQYSCMENSMDRGAWQAIVQWGCKEPDMTEQLHFHFLFTTYMQSTSREMLGWMKHKLESRLPGEISITSDMQMTPPLWQKVKKN